MMLRYRRLIDGDQVFSFLRKKSQTRRMTAYRIKLFTEHDTRRRLQLHFNNLPVCGALALVFAAGCAPSARIPGQRQVQTQTLDVAGQPPPDLAAPSSGAEENPADSQRLDQHPLSPAHDAVSPAFSLAPGDILRVS